MSNLTRREALLGFAAVGSAAVAGCVSDDETDDGNGGGTGNGDENGNDTNGENGTENGEDMDGEDDVTPELGDSSIETVNTSCGTGDDVTLKRGESTMTLEGTLPTSNPCYDATLEDVALDGDHLTVKIGAEPLDGGCMSCVGIVEYVADIELEGIDGVAAVTVDHSGGETHDPTADDGGDNDSSDGGDNTDDGGDGHEDGDDGTGEPLSERSITTIETGTRSENPDQASVDRQDRTVTIEGVLPASHPHHEAFIADAAAMEGTLTVQVGVRSTLSDGEVGTQPLGQVQYEATVVLGEETDVETVVVEHATGESHTSE